MLLPVGESEESFQGPRQRVIVPLPPGRTGATGSSTTPRPGSSTKRRNRPSGTDPAGSSAFARPYAPPLVRSGSRACRRYMRIATRPRSASGSRATTDSHATCSPSIAYAGGNRASDEIWLHKATASYQLTRCAARRPVQPGTGRAGRCREGVGSVPLLAKSEPAHQKGGTQLLEGAVFCTGRWRRTRYAVEHGFPTAFGGRVAVGSANGDRCRQGRQGAVDQCLAVDEHAGRLGFVQAEDPVGQRHARPADARQGRADAV